MPCCHPSSTTGKLFPSLIPSTSPQSIQSILKSYNLLPHIPYLLSHLFDRNPELIPDKNLILQHLFNLGNRPKLLLVLGRVVAGLQGSSLIMQ